MWVVGVPRTLPTQIVPNQLREGSQTFADTRLRVGGWVAVSEPIAREKHLRIGERFTLPTPSGLTSLRLAATIANYGWLSGAIVINGAEHARLWGSSTPPSWRSRCAPVHRSQGTRADASGAWVGRRGRAGSNELTAKSAGQRRAEVSAVLGSTLSRLNDTTIVVLIATIASVIALMMAAVWQGARGWTR